MARQGAKWKIKELFGEREREKREKERGEVQRECLPNNVHIKCTVTLLIFHMTFARD